MFVTFLSHEIKSTLNLRMIIYFRNAETKIEHLDFEFSLELTRNQRHNKDCSQIAFGLQILLWLPYASANRVIYTI